MPDQINIDALIKIVSQGGKITTGVDVYNDKGTLLLDKNFLVTNAKMLERIKENGVNKIPISSEGNSGIWDAEGNLISSNRGDSAESDMEKDEVTPVPVPELNKIEKRLNEIEETKKQAEEHYEKAKECIKQALSDIKNTGGQFDYGEVSSHVNDLAEYLTIGDNPFSYLTREIISYDDYLYNHSINVCTIGTTVMNKFNKSFSAIIDGHLNTTEIDAYAPFGTDSDTKKSTYTHFQTDELHSISVGFFLHDLGKVLIPDEILNKPGRLTDEEFKTVKKHSYDLGMKILEQNGLNSPFINSIVKYHHAPLYQNEDRCYPMDRQPDQIPLYAKVCKLVDIYDAMTSKRSYKEAFNQINVVTEIFRSYAKKEKTLQYILHSFIKSIGIYPPGSIVYLRNGQMGYVLESNGPFIIPFTDTKGDSLTGKPDPLDLGEPDLDEMLKIDNRRSIKKPHEVYKLLPSYLKPNQSQAEPAAI